MTRRRRRKIVPPSDSEQAPASEAPTPAPKPRKKLQRVPPETFADPLIGTSLGKCRIEKYIGEGKTSVVYRAHYEPLKRTVAVKVLLDKMAKIPAVLRVFQREGRAVAALDHENILKIYDVGEQDERYFLVLELLRGKELRDVIDSAEDGRLELGEALDYTRQAALGLAAAHRKNLIHRDIKPQNLVVEPDGTLKIVDFGLAAEAEGAFAGGRLGTPHYMSPEQCRGELAETASDVYALGITLFHMLVGHAPYSGAKTTDEIIERHLEGKRLEPEKLRKGLPGSVCELIRRMTRSSPKQRPSAKEVAETIDKMLKGGGAKVRQRAGGGARRRAAAPASSSKTPLFVGIGVVVVLAVFGLMSMGGDPPEEEEPPVAELPTDPTPPPEVKKEEPESKKDIELGADEVLNQLLKDAKQEESTGNFREALDLYQRVVDKSASDPESMYYRQAKAAVESVKKALRAELSGTRAKRVTAKGSEQVGERFDAALPEINKKLAAFQVDIVREELEELLRKTRKGTPENDRIQKKLDEIRYLSDLIGVVEGRVAGLSLEDSRWEKYDQNSDDGWIIVAATQKGITLKHQGAGTDSVRPWSQVPAAAAISLLDKLRSPTNGMHALRVGYYCTLVGSDKADIYFEMAKRMDPDLAPDVRKLQADLAPPSED